MRPRPVRDDFTVLLVADPPPQRPRPGGEGPAGRQEALVSLARAVFAEGGRIALPADAGVAVTMATVALEYEGPRIAERRTEAGQQHRVLVVETERPQRDARAFLAPFAARGVVEYLDPDGDPVLLGLGEPELFGEEGIRQPVTPELLRLVRPRAVVLISSSNRSFRDLAVLRDSGVPVVAFGTTAHDRGTAADLSAVDDPTRDRWASRWSSERESRTVPYAFLMQDLVARLTDRRGR
ncbi:hypothetical protein [Lentzea sp.]|uniref:hypothetical protein n=1 Tax=Lentzea sp. TaxID=56099 RepID=UPI002ED641CE